jgi:hypothetical protein
MMPTASIGYHTVCSANEAATLRSCSLVIGWRECNQCTAALQYASSIGPFKAVAQHRQKTLHQQLPQELLLVGSLSILQTRCIATNSCLC